MVDGETVDRLKIVDFEQPYKLRRNDFGYFTPEGEQEPITSENTRILQGFLEESNVNPVDEMVKMIELNREFDYCQKAIIAQAETLKTGINEVGRPR